MLPSVNFKSHLGRYELLAKMASGGMGEIFLARLEGAAGFEKLYVVKRILPHLADDLRFRGMLIDEARIASKLAHPNICQVYELGETDGELYIAMEYLEGVTLLPLLRHAVQTERPLELGLVACVIQQICEALHYAHELRDRSGTPLNIVHRDVTPSNIFVTESGQAKVLDFGIAKARNISSNTQTGTIKGKHAYMAPEQLRGAALDRRVDVFAVGILLFEMLALRRLFQRRTDYLSLQAVMEEAIPDVRQFRSDLPPALVATLGRALQRERDRRFETVRQLGAAIVDSISGVERVWTPSELGDQLTERFGADLRRRNAGILSAISRPPAAPGAAAAATAIPSIEELEVRGARPRARTRGATQDGSTDVHELPSDLLYAEDEDEDDLPSLGSAVYAATQRADAPENPMAAPLGATGAVGDERAAPALAQRAQANPAAEPTAVLGPMTGNASGPLAMWSPRAPANPTGAAQALPSPTMGSATGSIMGSATGSVAALDGGPPSGEAPAMVGYYSGVNPALLALPARRRSWPWALFAVALLGIAGAALFFVWRGSQRPQTVLVVERGNARANGQPLVVADDPERSPEPDPDEGAAPVGTTPPRPDAGAAGAGKPRDGKSRSAEDGDNDLRKRLNRMRPEIARCWSEHAGAATQVTDASVSFKLEPSGKVSSVQLTPAALSTTPTGACIRKVFLATRFPGQKESIDIKLQLSPKARPPI